MHTKTRVLRSALLLLLGACTKAEERKAEDKPTARIEAHSVQEGTPPTTAQAPAQPHAPQGNPSSTPSPECVEGLLSAENHANCKSKEYLEYAVNKTEFEQRRLSAQRLYALGEADFSAARYGKAFTHFSTSNVWVPSYRAMVKAGDAIFFMHASGVDPDGKPVDINGCSAEFVRATELQLPQTYDAALSFYKFDKVQTGLTVEQGELDQVLRKSTCLKQLADKHKNQAEACVRRSLIRNCLVRPE